MTIKRELGNYVQNFIRVSKFHQNYLQNVFNARRFMNVNNQACF